MQLEEKQEMESEASETQSKQEEKEVSEESEKPKSNGFGKKLPGKQEGAKGIWRTTPLVASEIVSHHPETCASCNSPLEIDSDAKPHMGYYVLELEKLDSGIEVKCTLHHYYQATCAVIIQPIAFLEIETSYRWMCDNLRSLEPRSHSDNYPAICHQDAG